MLRQTAKERAEDERIEREERLRQEANERLRTYNEKCQREEKALRKRVLDGLKAIARGEKQRLDPEAVEAAKDHGADVRRRSGAASVPRIATTSGLPKE